ncbi:MAG TPA: S53 family peptidase [Nocardioides sp.]|uniref:S53 family peptidase n=1 Tax=Nocardioides sp. TaxID=35761 RepID=UPI002E3147EC|nr:S53 family peptidase [Nocardioides sp.]HEX3931966.1 S53 family peptidase [Nocardioides sp.]
MRPSFTTSARRVAVALTTAAAAAAAVASVPAQASVRHDAPARPASAGLGSGLDTTGSAAARATRPQVVTLVTGDRVSIRHDASGRTIASLVPGSPHYGKPVEFVTTPTHTWVVPKLRPSVRRRFDTSVFDVAALARSGRVALRVTFAKGMAPRGLPGLGLRAGTTRRAAGGRTTALASYDARRALPASFAASLHGVRRISLADPVVPPTSDYELHTLTIDATTPGGKPLPEDDVYLLNADDYRLFDTLGGIVDGQWKVSVPTGNYFVVVSTFDRVVVREVSVADADTETSLSMADASVKPRMQAPPGFRAVDPEFTIGGSDQPGAGSFGFGFSGMFPRVSPVTDLAAGTLFTEVSDIWTPKSYHPVTFPHGQPKTHAVKRIVAAKQVRTGIPHNLTFAYHKRAYANVTVKHYSTGAKQASVDSWLAFSPVDRGVFGLSFATVRPGIVHASLLASKDLVWDTSTALSPDPRTFGELDQLAVYHRGQHPTVPFFRGPVTPVADRGGESRRVTSACELCVIDGTLLGSLAMVSSAGTDQFGISDHGRFKVSHGGRVLSKGTTFLQPAVKGVRPGQHLRLVASTRPPDKEYALSSRVDDAWKLPVPSRRRAIVPILRASYVPPESINGVGKVGRVAYPVTFDNLGPIDARVAKASVTWSVDGKHWHAATLRRTSRNTFRVSYQDPSASKAHPYLSLRVSARDAAGRSIAETVRHAYALPHGSTRRTLASTPQRKRDRFHPGRLCRTSEKHRYSCFVRLGRQTRATGRATTDPAGWGATALRDAYGIGADDGTPDTIAVIDAFGYPHAEQDMNAYRAQYGLPACTKASGCFEKLNQSGSAGNYPQQDYDWGVETALDLQMASTACPTCHIVLVEADDPSDRSFFASEQTAVNAGATVTSHSFGRIELTGAEADAAHYEHDGVTAVASTGDAGYGPASFPASSPDVVAVGGTRLARSSTDPRGWTEQAWSGASSGCSAYFDKPAGQPGTACHNRSIADVSAVARGIAVYDTSLPKPYRGWLKVNGTSASAPLVAGMIASVDGAGVGPEDLYAEYAGNAASFNDVVGGSNGFCEHSYICTGVPGYDGPTGLGSPSSPAVFAPPA